jgi:integrase
MTLHIDLRKKRGSAKELALTPNEKIKLLSEIKDLRDRVILLLGCYSGLRVSEIAEMRFSWLELTTLNGISVLKIKIPFTDISTRKQKYKDGGIKYGKFKQKKEWKTAIFIFEQNVINQIYSFYENNKEGLQMSRQNITTKRVKTHFSKILGRHITTHALRSTYTNYITQEFRFPNGEKPDPMFVKTQLRHKDLRTTMQHYKSETIAHQEAYLMGIFK